MIFVAEPQFCQAARLSNGYIRYSNPYTNGGYAVGTKAMFSCKKDTYQRGRPEHV